MKARHFTVMDNRANASPSGRDGHQSNARRGGRGRGNRTRAGISGSACHQPSDRRGGLGMGGRGGTSSKLGRGGGRGVGSTTRTSTTTRSKKQNHMQQQKKKDRPLPPLHPFTSDFASMHAKCQAARYKVHRPGCNCSKIKSIRERLPTSRKPTYSTNTDDSDASTNLNGLVVLPDIKRVDCFYLCLETDDETFRNEPRMAELKLRGELFSENDPNSGYLEQKNTSFQPYKVSCAQCLLIDEPNGFVCVSSPSAQAVAVGRVLALKRIRYKREEAIALHADHADHLAVMSRKILWEVSSARTRDQTNKASYSLVNSLGGQNINMTGGQQLDLGHHLESLLHITRNDTDADSALWLVMIQRSGRKWNIDLPGGKRHLGETSFEGATRECEEECSLTIDSTWVYGEPRRSTRKADEGNLYYMLRPPADVMMDSLENNPFWHEKGFCKEPALED